ncbi:response regulator transcription factor [Streptomyces inhibens]
MQEPVQEPVPPPDLPRILLDDDPAVLRSLEMLLSRRGFTVLCAADGTEALDAVHRLEPAAIVLDIEMHGLDGLTICRRIRAAMNSSRGYGRCSAAPQLPAQRSRPPKRSRPPSRRCCRTAVCGWIRPRAGPGCTGARCG